MRHFFSMVFLVLPLLAQVQRDTVPQKEQILELSTPMKAFLDGHVLTEHGDVDRLKALIFSVFDESRLSLEYSDHFTLTAGQTFEHRAGNCLSFTAMFVAMARYAGLSAYFQEVFDISSWSKNRDLTLFNRHMNAIVMVNGSPFEVDFNYDGERKFRITRRASDDRAFAHFFNNLGVEAMANRDYDLAHSLFQTSIEIDPSFSQSHTNLGVLFRVKGQYDLAEDRYKLAMDLDRFDYTARANLVRLYELQGRQKEAQQMRKKVERFMKRNPYYHLAEGEEAMAEGRFQDALQSFKTAIRRDYQEPSFYLHVASAYQAMGDAPNARKYVLKAKRFAKTYQDRERYNKKLALLAKN
jgi:tetratricopeptide (TPR) repeat protein